MEDTGIIRRVDELGRLVIPVKIREDLEMQEGEPIRLLIDRENKRLILEKYSIT